ncbi:ATP-binding protein [Streptomyces sp. NPDC050674]|uniref:sensor histidine kinase n=1 Tax=Streptomyces sp. NPDC050674 TaxID=3157216 RepID=UPI0034423384
MPVSLTDVVRAAVSEVEDYARVEVRRLPEAAVVGSAVADLTHLLAEIIENAAQFSPPHTRVRVTGEPVGNGYAVEVEDRGLGMGKETLAEANRRIAHSEALDLFDSDRLGLFVVSRLAARHDVKVHLRTSPYGGTTAVVLLPTALLQTGMAERSPEAVEPVRPSEERAYARVPESTRLQDAVPAQSDRRALVAPVPVATQNERVPHAGPSRDEHFSRDADRSGHQAPPRHEDPSWHEDPSRHEDSSGIEDSSCLADLSRHTEGPRHLETPSQTPPPGVATLRLHRPPQPDDSDDLPRRVRQASLAPQLRDGRPEERPPTPASQDDERTPELVRDRMAAYRDGWARGGGRRPGRALTHHPATGSDSSEGDPA